MERKELKKALKIALKKKQEVIVIYTNEIAFNDLYECIQKGNDVYNEAIEICKTEQRKYVVYSKTRDDEKIIAFICVPVKRLSESEIYLDETLKFCNKHLISGPFVLIPLKEVVKF